MGDDQEIIDLNYEECNKCFKDNYQNSKSKKKVPCLICEKKYHYQCIGITKNVADILCNANKDSNVAFTCDDCVSERNKVNDMVKKINKLEEMMNILLKKQEKYENEMLMLKTKRVLTQKPPTAQNMTPKRSWVDVLAEECEDIETSQPKIQKVSNVKTPVVNKPNVKLPVLIVKPKSKENKITEEMKEDMRNQVKSVLNPVNDPVRALRTSSSGKVVLECNDIASMEIVKQKIASTLKNDYVVGLPEATSPMLRVTNINESDFTNDNKLIVDLRKQNDDIIEFTTTMEVVSVKKYGHVYTALIRVDTNTFKRILEKQKLFIGWSSCRVYESFNVKRCFKCNKFDHIGKECVEKAQSCPKCAGNHEIKECKSVTMCCSNCTRMNRELNLQLNAEHYVWSTRCPVFQRKIESIRNKVRYKQ